MNIINELDNILLAASSKGMGLDEIDKLEEVIKYLKKNELIEFKPFEYPSWEEFEKSPEWYKSSYALVDTDFYISEEDSELWVSFNEFDTTFPFTEQGYKEACKWLNDKKYELCKQLAGG